MPRRWRRWCGGSGPWWGAAARVPGWATPGGRRADPGKDALARGIQAVAAHLEKLGHRPLQGLVSQREATKQFAMQAHALASQNADAVAALWGELEAHRSLLAELLAPCADAAASAAPMPRLVPGTTLSSRGEAEPAGTQQVVLPGLFAQGARRRGVKCTVLFCCLGRAFVDVLCANATSLSAHWQALDSLRWALLAAVEARIW